MRGVSIYSCDVFEILPSMGVMIRSWINVAAAPVSANKYGWCSSSLISKYFLANSYTEKNAACAGIDPQATKPIPR